MRCSVQCDDALTDKRLCTHVFVLMCSIVEVSLCGHFVIGVGRVIVQRHHADITNYRIFTFVL